MIINTINIPEQFIVRFPLAFVVFFGINSGIELWKFIIVMVIKALSTLELFCIQNSYATYCGMIKLTNNYQSSSVFRSVV